METEWETVILKKIKITILALGLGTMLVMLAIVVPLAVVSACNNVESNRTKVKFGNYFEYENEIEFKEENDKSEILDNASRSF